jgi:hypothetical protein
MTYSGPVNNEVPMFLIDQKIRYRGALTTAFSLRGSVEVLDESPTGQPNKPDYIGVRLENGNFKWARPEQIRTDTGD